MFNFFLHFFHYFFEKKKCNRIRCYNSKSVPPRLEYSIWIFFRLWINESKCVIVFGCTVYGTQWYMIWCNSNGITPPFCSHFYYDNNNDLINIVNKEKVEKKKINSKTIVFDVGISFTHDNVGREKKKLSI